MKKLIKFKVYDDVFETVCEFIIGDIDQANKYIQREYDDVIEGNPRGYYTGIIDEIGAVHRFIYISMFDNKIEGYEILTHEVIHLVDRIFGKKNLPTDEDITELRAYYTTFWMKQFIKKYNARKK